MALRPPITVVLAAVLTWACSQAPARAGEWRKLDTVPYTLNNKQDAIAFADAQTGWYGNGTGRVYKTTDGGDHWRLAWHHPGTYVRALEFVDAQTGFLGNVGPGYFDGVRDGQPLYVTHDAGATWAPVAYEGPRVTGICAIDVLHAADGRTIVHAGGRVGGPAGLLESLDGGATWRALPMNGATGMILDVRFLDPQTGFIAGASEAREDRAHARILKTTDGGTTWRPVYESARQSDNNWKLAFPSARVGYGTIISYDAPAGSARGYVVKTQDGGEHWAPQTVTRDPLWIPYGIAFVDESHGFVGGSTGGYETRDGGTTWTKAPMSRSVNKMRFVTDADGKRHVFAIGEAVYRGEVD